MDLGRNGLHVLAELADPGRPSIAATTRFATDVPVGRVEAVLAAAAVARTSPLATS